MATDTPTTPPGTTVPTTHPKGFFFLFAGEFAERFSFYGMRAILPLYLSDQMGFGEEDGGRYYTFFLAACYLLPLLGGYIADNFFGKYWTIVGFSLPYVAGQFLVGFENKWFLLLALALLAMGTGVIKPNISTLMGITYDQQRPGQDKLRSNAFQYFYMSINIGAFLSQLIVPAVRDATGSYLYAFLVPAVFMVVALAIFAAGKPYYGTEDVRRKEPETAEQQVAKLRVLGQVFLLFLLVSFFWAVFDQSSYTWVFFAKTYMDLNVLGYNLAPDSIQALNPFFIVLFIGGALAFRTLRPARPGEVERPGMAPTTKMLIGFLLTAACMGVMAVAGYLTGDPEKGAVIKTGEVEIYTPLGKAELSQPTIDLAGKDAAFGNAGGTMTFPGSPLRLTFAKYSAADADGFKFRDGELELGGGKKLYFKDGRVDFDRSRELFAGGTFEVPGSAQVILKPNKRYQLADGVLVTNRGNAVRVEPGATLPPSRSQDKPSASVGPGKYTKPENKVSVWWMALAFLVITVAEVLISVTGLELAFVVAPKSMKGFITACWLLTVFVANAFINAPIAGLYPAMHPGQYFLLLAVVGLAVAGLFVPVSRRFNRAMEEKARKEREASVAANTATA
ncbi:MAG: MFS transporter [Isosphaera sp.]|nr:MFS transporter [Isosphaera sp.]